VNSSFPPAERKQPAWQPPQVMVLPGERLHLQHGPIDLIIRAEGKPPDIRLAYAASAERFRSLLGELVGELALLRQPLSGDTLPVACSAVANRMIAACWPHRDVYITPMAAVAGSVADEIMTVMLDAAPGLHTVYVNNGGDIAVHVAKGETLKIGVVAHLARAAPEGIVTITPESGIRGIATSGWRGRSFSRGIADAVTVLAGSAAGADAAATIIANAVDLEDPAVVRAPARSLDPDSDLEGICVTTAVGPLNPERIAQALLNGHRQAERLIADGLAHAAAIALQGRWKVCDEQSGLLWCLD
jgi:uncharacterized protein